MEQIPKPYFFIYTDHDFYFRTNGDTFPQKYCICINRLTSKVSQLSPQQFQASTYQISAKNSQSLHLIVGIITILTQPYLCIVNKCDYVGIFMNDPVYLVKDVKFIPFKHRFLYGSIDQSECEKLLEGIRTQIINDNFYFCYHQDITLTYDKQFTKSRRPTERKYFWNEDLLKIFARHKLPLTWRIPIMQGFISQIKGKNNFFSYHYLNVSRRSKYMSGTRFNSRGIDHSFNTANSVQTQQIFSCHNYIFSHVSLRGSVPLFWQQNGFGADIKFTKQRQEDNQTIIEKYFELLSYEYQGVIVAINLLSKTKTPEKQLKNRYEFYYYKSVKGNYLYFDLNQEATKENSQKIIQNFVNTNIEVLAGEGNFFCMDTSNKKILCRQKTIPRINCLDCIDRTNVIMARISELYLKQVQYFINALSKEPQRKLQLGRQFDSQLLQTWTKLGNRISMMYCGTQSVASHLTKKQNNSFFSFFSSSVKSINRYYNANINDSMKQEYIDYFLGNKQQNSSSMQYFEDNITTEILKNQQLKYCTHEEYGMYIVTWNCNMVDPKLLKEKDFEKLLNFPRQDVDFVVICLQEMVQLNSYNVILGNNQSVTQIWRKILWDYINSQNKMNNDEHYHKAQSKKQRQYDFLTSYDLVGISTFVFVNSKITDKIRDLQWFEIKTGFKGSLGNKGAIILFMTIDSTPITFISCHLAAGQSKASFRIQDIDFIHRDAIKDRAKRRFFDVSQFRFFIGDFNFRLEANNQSVRQMLYSIEKQDQNHKLSKQQLSVMLSPLLQKDQFRINCTSGSLSSYTEPEIYFLPSYKYVKKQKSYDTKRTPSWCDRILFHRKQKLKLSAIRYSDIDIYLSDHKPVAGMYRFLCKREDLDKKKKLIQMYYDS